MVTDILAGRTMTLHLQGVDLSDWTRAARRLAEAIVPHVGREPEWRAVPPECAAGSNGKRALPPWGSWAEGLPHTCDTLPALDLPTSSELLAAVARDNALVALRQELPAQWAREQPLVARARFRAGIPLFWMIFLLFFFSFSCCPCVSPPNSRRTCARCQKTGSVL